MKWLIFICIFHIGLCISNIPLEPKCDEISGPGTLEKVQVATSKWYRCTFELDRVPKKITFEEAKEKGKFNEFIANYHTGHTNLFTCLNEYVQIAKLCLTKEQNTYLNSFIAAIHKVIAYIYENDGQRFIEFLKQGGYECINSHMTAFVKCDYDNNPFPFHKLYDGPGLMMSGANCKNYEKYENCVLQEIEDNCPSNSLANITKGVMYVLKSSLCSDYKIKRSRRSLRRIVRDVGGMGSHLSHIETAVKNGCAKYGEPLGKLDESLEKAKKCVKEKPMFLTPQDEFIKHLDYCTKDTIKVFEKCLPDKLKYFPKFLFDLIDSLVRFLYNDFVLIGEALGPCINKLKSTESQTKYNQCVIDAGGEHEDDIPTSKEKFCKKFIPISQCFVTQINDTCTHSKELSKFNEDYMHAMKQPCGL